MQNPDKSTARIKLMDRFKRWKVNQITRQTVPNINDTLCGECWPHCTAAMSLIWATTCTAKSEFEKIRV